MKKAAIVAISIVAVIVFIGVFVGVGSNQAGEQTEFQKTLEESVSLKSEPQSPSSGTEIIKNMSESVQSSSEAPSSP